MGVGMKGKSDLRIIQKKNKKLTAVEDTGKLHYNIRRVSAVICKCWLVSEESLCRKKGNLRIGTP